MHQVNAVTGNRRQERVDRFQVGLQLTIVRNCCLETVPGLCNDAGGGLETNVPTRKDCEGPGQAVDQAILATFFIEALISCTSSSYTLRRW